ncbi:MAG TPA: helix-turn-helix transcriptional regulator [Jiangellales bacterium]|nr:helix-turn-helix transcriptional regulator [Jiangellales bacterium]
MRLPGQDPEPVEACRRGREAAAGGDWAAAFRAFEQVADDGALGADDLALWSTAGYLLGRVDAAIDAMSKAHDAYVVIGEAAAAVRCGFWVVFMLLGRGQHAQAGGWLARCGHEAEQLSFDSAERGYVTLTRAHQAVAIEHRYDEGGALAGQVVGLARCGRDPDLLALALMIAGRARIRAGETHDGFAMLDEAMVGVVRDEVSATVAGTVYCAVIEACGEVGELRRAVEWTQALATWCDRQRGMVTFTGRCRTHRAAVLMLQGDWDAAVAEANSACASFAGAADEAAVGEAFYLLAELHRLAGRDALAEQASGQASEWGREPQPGLALLRLGQGRAEAAVATVNRLIEEPNRTIDRVRVLPAAVVVHLDVGDVASAEAAAEELAEIAGSFNTPGLRAAAAHAGGAVLLARNCPAEALARLRDAAGTWRSVGAVFELARTRVLIAEACRRLGDDDGATLELAAARRTLADLGAGPAVAALPPDEGHRYGLSERELEVLRMVATGMTNREVAERLSIAVRTVDRHVANIFTKLGVPSRTAATRFAYEHRLV